VSEENMKTPEQMARELCKDWPKEVYHGDLVIFFVKGFEAAIEQEAKLIEQTESNESSASVEITRLRKWCEKWGVTSPQPQANFLDGFEDGANFVLKELESVGVEGARKFWIVGARDGAVGCSAVLDKKVLSQYSKGDEDDIIEAIELAPALAKLASLEEQIKVLVEALKKARGE